MARRQPNQLTKLLCYILGRRPDEFGLVPSSGGFVPLKELLQAVKEEEGWSYVRQADLREVLMIQPGRFDVVDDQIRLHPNELSGSILNPKPAPPPEILYHGARQRAYPHIIEHGLLPKRYPHVPLASHEKLALRIGRRRDPHPVLIKIDAATAHEAGILFSRLGELLYLVTSVPPVYLEGPPLPRETTPPPPKKKPEEESYKPPGSFEIDLRSIPKRLKQERERRSESWKKEARRYRKMRRRGLD